MTDLRQRCEGIVAQLDGIVEMQLDYLVLDRGKAIPILEAFAHEMRVEGMLSVKEMATDEIDAMDEWLEVCDGDEFIALNAASKWALDLTKWIDAEIQQEKEDRDRTRNV